MNKPIIYFLKIIIEQRASFNAVHCLVVTYKSLLITYIEQSKKKKHAYKKYNKGNPSKPHLIFRFMLYNDKSIPFNTFLPTRCKIYRLRAGEQK